MSEQNQLLDFAWDVVGPFINAIEATGGVFRDQKGWHTPAADPDWVDLGEAYVHACRLMGRPVVVNCGDEPGDDDE